MNKTAWLYLAAEFGPIIVLFVAGRMTDFSTAVAYFMGAVVVACGFAWIRVRHIPTLPILSALFVLIGGAITLI